MCPATTCLKVLKQKKLAFEEVTEDIEVIGVNTCGGCPGKKAVMRVSEMVKRGRAYFCTIDRGIIPLEIPVSRSS